MLPIGTALLGMDVSYCNLSRQVLPTLISSCMARLSIDNVRRILRYLNFLMIILFFVLTPLPLVLVLPIGPWGEVWTLRSVSHNWRPSIMASKEYSMLPLCSPSIVSHTSGGALYWRVVRSCLFSLGISTNFQTRLCYYNYGYCYWGYYYYCFYYGRFLLNPRKGFL